jgi:hypothetical protein
MTNRMCYIPVTLFLSTYSYSIGSLMQVRGKAINSIGLGGYSQLNTVGAIIATNPG